MATQQHRILIYVTCYNVLDGVSLTLRKLEQELLAAGHAVCVLTTVSGDPAYTHLDGEHPNRQVLFMNNSIPIPFLTDPNHPELSYQLGFSLSADTCKAIEEFEPTLIHLAVTDCTSLHLVHFARRKEIPLMGTYHSNIPEYMEHYPGISWLKHILWGFFRHQYNFYQSLYVPTPYIQNFLQEEQKIHHVTNIGVWGRGVDVEKFTPAKRSLDFRREFGISDKEVVVCWCGRLVPEKRVDIFCDTIRRLDALGLPFRALVVGAGPCEEEVKALPRTIFAGWQNAEALSVAYASSDVFLFPSSVETFGNVTLEAMSAGLPVIVEAACSGHLVHENQNGFACQAGDKDAFFEATRRLVQDHSMRAAYSRRSREIALSLEKSKVVQEMLTHYTTVTNEFYSTYGGHHCNRDKAYRNPYSFVAGNYPRPMLLVLIEWLFVVVFRVCWNLTEGLFWMQRMVVTARPPITTTSASRPSSPRSPKRASFEPSNIKPMSPHVLEMQDVDLDASPTDALHASDSGDEEDTHTTASSGDHSHGSSAAATSTPVSRKTCADGPVFHSMAIGFIRSTELICRTECAIRNACKCRETPMLWGRKRKNSSDMEADEEEERGGLLEGRRMRRNPGASSPSMLVV